MNEKNELAQLSLLLEAMRGEEPPEWEKELREGALSVLTENPDITEQEWRTALTLQYPSEIVDTFGTDPMKASGKLHEMWLKIT